MRTSRSFWRAALALLLVASFLLPATVFPQVAYAAGTVNLGTFGLAVTENFDTLANTGTSSVTPTGWYFSEVGATTPGLYTAGTGSSNTGDTYSFGASASNERAFGGLQSGSLNPTIGASFVNATGGTITDLAIAYVGEQWRLGTTARVDRLDFQYSLDATALTSGTWTDVDGLDFSSPYSTTVGALDGNAAANRTARSLSITGLNIPANSVFWIRWNDSNASGADDGLSVDDFSITPTGFIPPEAAPSVSTFNPANGAVNVPATSSLTVTFSEAVNLGAGALTLVCNAQPVTFALGGGPISFTVNPDANLPYGSTCTLTVKSTAVTDVDADDPPDNMVDDAASAFTVESDPCSFPFTPTYEVQGNGATTPIPGNIVTVQGVVVGDYEHLDVNGDAVSDTLRGFFMQDLTGDGDAQTSDGLFVFNGNNTSVELGQVVRVTGTAGENQGQTQLNAVTSIIQCGTGAVAPTPLLLPMPSDAGFEALEGMLVTNNQLLTVSETFHLGRGGSVLLAAGGRLWQPTQVVLPGVDATNLQAANNLRRIYLDDALQLQNPDPIPFARGGQPLSAANTLRSGDTIQGVVGVLGWGWAGYGSNAWRIRPINALNGSLAQFQPSNPRPVNAPQLNARLRVVGINVLNYFNTWDDLPDVVDNCTLGVGGLPTDCRGADTASEFVRQYDKTTPTLAKLTADVVGLVEIENDGYGAESAIQDLVTRLNAMEGAGTWAFIDPDAATGVLNSLGTDAIKVGLIYKPAKVTPVGATATLSTTAFVYADDLEARNRPALAQAFTENSTNAKFVVVVNHLKSKGSACDIDLEIPPPPVDGQGNCAEVRTIAADRLFAWLETDPTGTGDPDILLVGDMNSYAKEDPITLLEGEGFVNLLAARSGPEAYSYVFDGQWGNLDHALGSPEIEPQVVDTTAWHINSDEPVVLDYNFNFKSPAQWASLYLPDEFRSADHDPILVDLNLTNLPPTATTGGPYTVDEGGVVTISGSGSDPEGSAVTFAWDLNNDGAFETPGATADFAAVDGPGTPEVKFRATDISGLFGLKSPTITVANVAPALAAISGLPGNTQTGVAITGTAVFTDPGTLDTHTAVWQWGDGSSTAGVVTEASGDGSASGSHAYAAPGSYTVILTVTDKDGGVDSVTFGPITVTAPTAAAGGPYSVNEGASVALNGSGTDPDGGAVTLAWDLDNNGSFETAGAAPDFNAVDGPAAATVRVRATTTLGSSAVATATVNIANVSPELSVIAGLPLTVTAGVPVTGTASFTDPGALDTHTALWTWGDGNSTAGVVTEAGGDGSVSGSHAFGAAGSFTVTLVVTDKDGGQDIVIAGPITVVPPTVFVHLPFVARE